MCLTKANKINVKDGGLKVYKFLIHNFDEPEGVYHSPYYDSAWVIGKLHTKNEFDDVFDGSTNTKNPKLPLKVILNDNLNKNYDLIGYG